MGKKKKQPSLSERYERLKHENRQYVDEIRRLEDTLRSLRTQIGWTRNLDPDQQRILKTLHHALDTLALMASANQAIRTDRVRAKGANEAEFNPEPVWAHNRLAAELDHLAQRADDIRSFAHRPREVRRARNTCRRCHQPLSIALRRYCDWCGHPLPGRAITVQNLEEDEPTDSSSDG